MVGLSKHNGQLLDTQEHIVQSIGDIITTVIHSRTLRRDYGSKAPRLIDKPITPGNVIEWFVAIAEALYQWEPRFRLKRITDFRSLGDGQASMALEGENLVLGKDQVLEVVL